MGDWKPLFFIPNNQLSIKYNDVFSMKELYVFIRDWLLENGYVDEGMGDTADRWMETYYYENISQTSGKEMFISWRTSKTHGDRKFVKWHLHIDYRVLAMKDIETTFRGKKIKAQKGEVEIMINGFTETDYQNKFSKSWVFQKMEKMNNFFTKKMYKSNIEETRKDFIEEIKELQEKIKNFLEMPSNIEHEPFKPKRGL